MLGSIFEMVGDIWSVRSVKPGPFINGFLSHLPTKGDIVGKMVFLELCGMKLWLINQPLPNIARLRNKALKAPAL